MNESLVLENPRSDGWPGKQPDQEDEATQLLKKQSNYYFSSRQKNPKT